MQNTIVLFSMLQSGVILSAQTYRALCSGWRVGNQGDFINEQNEITKCYYQQARRTCRRYVEYCNCWMIWMTRFYLHSNLDPCLPGYECCSNILKLCSRRRYCQVFAQFRDAVQNGSLEQCRLFIPVMSIVHPILSYWFIQLLLSIITISALPHSALPNCLCISGDDNVICTVDTFAMNTWHFVVNTKNGMSNLSEQLTKAHERRTSTNEQ